MLFSKDELFSDDQAITATAVSTNVIDLGDKDDVFSNGKPVPILIQVTETFATLTSLQVAVQADDDEAFGSATTVVTTAAIAAATLVAGYKFVVNYVPRVSERYLRLSYTVAGSDATAGKITAGIIMADQTNYRG